MRRLLTLAAVVSSMSPGMASATPTDSTYSSTASYSGFVNYIEVKHNGTIQLQLRSASGTSLGCATKSYLLIDSALSANFAHQQLLTAAMLAGKSVDVWYENISGVCYGKKVVLNR